VPDRTRLCGGRRPGSIPGGGTTKKQKFLNYLLFCFDFYKY